MTDAEIRQHAEALVDKWIRRYVVGEVTPMLFVQGEARTCLIDLLAFCAAGGVQEIAALEALVKDRLESVLA